MIRQFWRLTEGGENNLGPSITEDGLNLGRTPLLERRDERFVVRERREIERLLTRAYQTGLAADRLMPGLATVASALNANDPCLARIAAVHLRIPDLPDQAARDGMEAEDILIKSADWNPALHPRAGTPPNPGWFAPTDGSSDGSSSIRTAQNDDQTRRSDAAESVGENRVILPPGERNDELDDLLEWIANAKPGDEQTIRAEIKRSYYDVGDTSGGNALTAALSNALGPGIEYKDRQKILDAIGPYSQSAQDDQSTEFWIGAGLLLLSMIPPAAGVEAASAAWELPVFVRGKYFDAMFRDGTLHPLSRTIDNFTDGNAISIKSINLNAATYQDFVRLTSPLNRYFDKLEEYPGTNWGGDKIEPSDISARTLNLIVPKNSMTAVQRAAIDAAQARAKSKGMDLIITEF
jgi:hypothetical protein